jgi:hypothetical protein
MEQRGAHTAGERDPALQVAETRSLHGRCLGAERRHGVGHPAAGQVRGRVEPTLVAVRAADAGPGTASDDDVRIERADVLDRQPRPFERARQPVRQEHVRGGEKATEVLAAGVGLDIDRHTALATVADFQDEVDVGPGVLPGETADDQCAPGVTGLDVLHLDDVGAPVRKRRAGRRHVSPGGQLDNPHAAQDLAH